MTVNVDTFTGSDGSTAASPWVLVTLSGSQSIQSNKWHIASGGSYAGTAMTYGATTYTDVDITVTVTMDAGGGEQYPGIGARMAGGTNGWAAFTEVNNGYIAYFDTLTDHVAIAKETSGAVVGSPVTAALTLTGGTTYKLRLQIIGTDIKAKGWDASGGEPGAWMVTMSDATYTSGLVGFRDQTNPAQTSDWDDWTFDDAPFVPPPTPALVQAIGTQVSNAAATTTVISYVGAVKPAVGDLVVVYGSRDNVVTDPLTGDSFADSDSNTYTRIVNGSNVATALAGVVGVMFYSFITTAWSAGTNTLTWTHPSTKAAMQMEHWTGLSGGVRGSNTATSTAGAPSCALAGILHGDLVLAMEAIEYSTAGTSTGDSDTTGGPAWSTVTGPTATTGTTLAAVKVISQWKIPTADGTQTYNPTHSVTTNVDTVAIVAAFIPPVSMPSMSPTTRRSLRGLVVR